MDSTALASSTDDSARPGLKKTPTGIAGLTEITGVGLPSAEAGTGADTGGRWDLVVYVTDESPKGRQAIENLRRACETHRAGRYSIEIVDVLENPRRAVADQILASPTVVRRFPKPIRKLVGDLADTDRLIMSLGL
jgi:circadian clock protein KaiB